MLCDAAAAGSSQVYSHASKVRLTTWPPMVAFGFGLGVDFATGAGAGWEGAGTASMGMDVNAW